MKTYLPPPPALPDEGTAESYQPRGKSILELLAAEHGLLTRTCAQLRLDPSREGSRILCETMQRHLSTLKTLRGEEDRGAPAMLEIDRQLLSDMDILLWSPTASGLWDEALTRTESYLREHIRDCVTELSMPA